jgi:hypothetical protein
MDEQKRIYNTEKILDVRLNIDTAIEDDIPVRCPDGLKPTDFKYKVLFQNPCIAFYM